MDADAQGLGIRLGVDTNFFPVERSSARIELWQLHLAGYIELARTDVVATELWKAGRGEHRDAVSQASDLSEYLGPFVVGHSRLNSAVVGSKGDQELLDEVFGLLHPGKVLSTARDRDVRDAMHIAWARRYAFDGFVTEDRGLLRLREAIRERFRLSIFSPQEALAFVTRLKGRAEIRNKRLLGRPAN